MLQMCLNKLTHVVVGIPILEAKGNLPHSTQFTEFPLLVIGIIASTSSVLNQIEHSRSIQDSQDIN